MHRLQLFDVDGQPTDDLSDPSDIQRLLHAMGVEAGRWHLRKSPLSATPLLTYAGELCSLERRFGTARTDLAHLRPAAAMSSPRWREAVDLHVHDEVELRVVLQGQLLYTFRDPSRAGWAALLIGPGDWLALPAGVAHAVDAGARPHVDLLRLFGAGEGWLPRATPAARPAHLPHLEALLRAVPQARAA
ncbi:hypothetical protein [Ideonella sp. A 288]|uniref:hypothetical protein n=1 Tax=Ideonella sp. A 288 TaxID=1962181 RepID=UPI000B4A609F|nr:hypothetical protein [Ideonella sp. A 288]